MMTCPWQSAGVLPRPSEGVGHSRGGGGGGGVVVVLVLVLGVLQAGGKQGQRPGCMEAADVWCGSRPAVKGGLALGRGAHEHLTRYDCYNKYCQATVLEWLRGQGKGTVAVRLSLCLRTQSAGSEGLDLQGDTPASCQLLGHRQTNAAEFWAWGCCWCTRGWKMLHHVSAKALQVAW